MRIQIPTGPNVRHTVSGLYRDISYSVDCFRVQEEPPTSYDMYAHWTAYVYLSEEQHESMRDRIESAPWNGGQTYYRKITEEHIGVPPEWVAKWNKPYYKIGHDYSHIWDMERHRGDLDVKHVENEIKRVIDFLLDGPKGDE